MAALAAVDAAARAALATVRWWPFDFLLLAMQLAPTAPQFLTCDAVLRRAGAASLLRAGAPPLASNVLSSVAAAAPALAYRIAVGRPLKHRWQRRALSLAGRLLAVLPALALDRRAALAAVSLALAAVAPPGSPAAGAVGVARRVGARTTTAGSRCAAARSACRGGRCCSRCASATAAPSSGCSGCFPSHHPHAERRSLVASVAAMEFFAPVAVAGLLGFPLPDPSSAAAAFAFAASSRAPLADSFPVLWALSCALDGIARLPISHSTRLYAGVFHPNMPPLPPPQGPWLRLHSIAACFVTGSQLGYAARLPLVALYGKARKWLLRVAFESAERRLHRKLAHAAEHAHGVRARLGDPARLLRRLARAAEARPPGLQRQPTLVLQKAAAEGLARKQSALETRIAAQAERLEIVTPERVRVRLAVRRATLRGALRQLARVPPLALLRGKVAIRFLGEPAVDAGGVFRDFIHAL